MRPIKLSLEERALITDTQDIVYLETVKGHENEGSLNAYDCYKPTDLKHYNHLQTYWLEKDRELLEDKVHHKVSELELLKDYTETTHNAQRYRIFYCLKYARMVKRDYRKNDVIEADYKNIASHYVNGAGI